MFGEGSDAFIDRNKDTALSCMAGDAGIGPRVIACFDGGRIEEFLSGSLALPLGSDMFPQDGSLDVPRQLAMLLGEFHRLPAIDGGGDGGGCGDGGGGGDGGSRRGSLVPQEPVMAEMLGTVLKLALSRVRRGQFRSKRDALMGAAFNVEGLQKEVAWLSGMLSKAGSPVVTAHNDVNEGNVLRDTTDGSLVSP